MNQPTPEALRVAESARTIALQMLEERGRGAVLVGVARVDTALRDYILLITILVAFLEAAAQQLRPFQPPVVMSFSGVTVS